MNKITDIVMEVEKLKANQKFNQAIEILEKSIIEYNDDYRLYEELADIYLFQGELDKALKSINHALSLNKDSATGCYLKGFILLSKDKVADAIKFLEKSNELLGNNSEVLRNLGWAYTLE
jgi:tetratricopeptide (TPR) repeat protein